jgi:hypothetical protein
VRPDPPLGPVDPDGRSTSVPAWGSGGGQWPGGEPDEALSLYARRYDGLALEVDLLERRVRRGLVSPDEARSAVMKVRDQVVGAQAVGDLETLADRLDALAPLIDEQRQQRRAEKAARLDRARATKENVVAEAEKVAAGTDWRAGPDRMRTLMDGGRSSPSWRSRRTTRCGDASRRHGARTRGGDVSTMPSSRSNGAAPSRSRRGLPTRPSRWPRRRTGAPRRNASET